MADPDPIAALAAQLEELRGQLARYTGETGHLRARLEADSGQVVMLRLEIKKLGEKIDGGDRPPGRRRAAGPVLARPEPGGVRGPPRRAARLGRPGAPGSVARLLRQAPAVLAEPPGGGQRALQRHDRVDPDLRRRGQPGPAGRAVVVRALAARRPGPPGRGRQVRRGWLPAAVAVGAVAAALHLTVPKAPACFPCAGAFCMPGLADLHLGLGVLFRLPARNGPERRQAARRPQGTARPGVRGPQARRCPPGPSQRAARGPARHLVDLSPRR